MRKPNLIRRLRIVVSFAGAGAVTASVFFGWIDRSIDMHTIGAVIGAGAATLKVFDIV
jgi:hypothetical protein